MRGRYLALEGIEGSGKSTLTGLVAERLEELGRDVVVVREPGGTPLGESIRHLLLGGEAMTPWAEAALFAAQRAQLANEVIRPRLDSGGDVVSDRSVYSSLAYQGAGRGLGVDEVRQLNWSVLDGIVPDTVVVVDVDPSVGLARQRRPDRIGSEGIAFARVVRKAFLHMAMEDPDRVKIIDGDKHPRELAGLIVQMMLS